MWIGEGWQWESSSRGVISSCHIFSLKQRISDDYHGIAWWKHKCSLQHQCNNTNKARTHISVMGCSWFSLLVSVNTLTVNCSWYLSRSLVRKVMWELHLSNSGSSGRAKRVKTRVSIIIDITKSYSVCLLGWIQWFKRSWTSGYGVKSHKGYVTEVDIALLVAQSNNQCSVNTIVL